MRVLLLSHSFPPDGEVGSLRAAKVSEAFAAAGHEVHVVTTRLGGELEAIRAPGEGITLRTVRAVPHPPEGLSAGEALAWSQQHTALVPIGRPSNACVSGMPITSWP